MSVFGCFVLKNVSYKELINVSLFSVLNKNVKNSANFAFVCLSFCICCWACFAFFWFSWTRLTASSVTLFISCLTPPPTSIPSKLGHISFAIPIDKLIKCWIDKISLSFFADLLFYAWNSMSITYTLWRSHFFVLIWRGEVDEWSKSARC